MRRALQLALTPAWVYLGISFLGCNALVSEDAPPKGASTSTGGPSKSASSAPQARSSAKPAKGAPSTQLEGAAAPTSLGNSHIESAANEELADSAETEGATESASDAETGAEASCPSDMALVEGGYCRNVDQRCLEYVTDVEGSPDKSRCKKFAEPVLCLDTEPRRPMRYCMDRYEWPNKQGEIPSTLVSWEDAARMCNSVGKRLCTESEFNFACEGEELHPHATGFERDSAKCNIDREFKKKRREMLPEARCEASPRCKAEMERLDGREPAGSRESCVSPFGIYDLNGNVNEWVSMPWKEPGKRSAIKGGWWGPVRNRCRPIVQSHGETYIGYEVGFRCCSDANSPSVQAKAASKATDEAENTPVSIAR